MKTTFVIDKRQQIKTIIERFERQYHHSLNRPLADGKTPNQTINELKQLDLNTATEQDIANVIGNKSWTRIPCNLCEKDVDFVIGLEALCDMPYWLCKDCINAMHEKLTSYLIEKSS